MSRGAGVQPISDRARAEVPARLSTRRSPLINEFATIATGLA
jgi:hypothetical protein